MTVTGIIAEYNPFHNGHAYQMEQARKMTGADYLVIVMSGDYVQRGTPAIIEKHLRAKMALNCGADLVLELPVRYATSSARDFAKGAVSILNDLGVVDYLCFGSEHGSISPFLEIADIVNKEPNCYKTILKEEQKKGCSYPAAHQKALQRAYAFTYPNRKSDLSTEFLCAPNNILGIEYIRALKELNSSIIPCTVHRTSNNYHSIETDSKYASATAIRRLLLEKKSKHLKDLVPHNALTDLMDCLKNNSFMTEDDYSLLLKYSLLQHTADQLTSYLDFPKSLANRAVGSLSDFQSFSQFSALLKTRDITRTRINRSLLHAILNIDQREHTPSFLRMLGFRRDAVPLLTAIKKSSRRPLVGKLADSPPETYYEDLFASNLYHSVAAIKSCQATCDERSIPLVIINS